MKKYILAILMVLVMAGSASAWTWFPIASSIVDGVTSQCPDGNSVFDALAGKANLISPTFTTPVLGNATATSIILNKVNNVAGSSLYYSDNGTDTTGVGIEGPTGSVTTSWYWKLNGTSPTANSIPYFGVLSNNKSSQSWAIFDTDGTLASNSDTRVATQKAVKTYAAPIISPSITDSLTVTSSGSSPVYITGTITPDSNRSILVDAFFANTVANGKSFYGIYSLASTIGSTYNITNFEAGRFYAYLNGGIDVTNAYGFDSRVYLKLEGTPYTGTVTNGYGFYSKVENVSSAGTITNGYGAYIASAINSGGGNYINNYGLYIGDQSAVGSTLTYNLYSAGTGKNYFNGTVGIGVTPTARLHIAAGSEAAGTAPFKLTTGTALTAPEDGAVEYHSSHLYFTIGSTRYQLDQQTVNIPYLPITGGTLTGNLLFTDNTYDIGSTGATRPRTGYFGTSVIAPVGTFATSVSTPLVNIGTTSAGGNASIVATLNSEIAPALEDTNWTGTDGWSEGSGQLIKVAGSGTGTETPSGTFTVTAGTTYKVTMTVSAISGVIKYTLGGQLGSDLTATTFTDYITATTTGKIIFSGGATDTCTITALSVQALTNATGDLTVDGNLTVRSPVYIGYGTPSILNNVLDVNGQTNIGNGDSLGNAIIYVGSRTPNTSDGTGGFLYLGKLGSVPDSNKRIGAVFFEARTTTSATSLVHVAQIRSNVVTGATTRNLMTGDLQFFTKGSGVDDPSVRMYIAPEGGVTIGAGATPPSTNNKLEVKDGIIAMTQTTIPTCACSGGGSCVTTTGDTDESGTMTCAGGGASTTMTLTFNMTHARAPICMIQAVPSLASQYQSTLSTTAPVFTITSTTDPVARYICR
uniref:Putative tail collar domain protein n=1 Tax=viral metagenome TaxID=1070528 RepID=A0A6M3J9J7_9ZZZZ